MQSDVTDPLIDDGGLDLAGADSYVLSADELRAQQDEPSPG